MLPKGLQRERDLRRRLLWGAIAVVSLALSSCGSNQTAQCKEILRTIQQADAQLSLGEQTRETQQADAQLYQTLADDLSAMTIKNKALQTHQIQLAEAYRNMVIAINSYIEVSNEEGRLSYREGDIEAEANVNAVSQNKCEHAIKLTLQWACSTTPAQVNNSPVV